jgi:hypothetical protein
MKKIILAAALLLSAVGASTTTINKFQDPVMECPPMCVSGGNVVAIN